jgi:hypothetical protein
MTSLESALRLIYSHVGSVLPKSLTPSPFVIPLAYTLPDPKQLIENICGELWKQEYVKHNLFINLTRQLYFNFSTVSGISDPEEPKKTLYHYRSLDHARCCVFSRDPNSSIGCSR